MILVAVEKVYAFGHLFAHEVHENKKIFLERGIITMVSRSKKVVALLLTAMMAAGALASCGPTTQTSSTPASTQPSSTTESQASQTEQPSQASALVNRMNAMANTDKKPAPEKKPEEAPRKSGLGRFFGNRHK